MRVIQNKSHLNMSLLRLSNQTHWCKFELHVLDEQSKWTPRKKSKNSSGVMGKVMQVRKLFQLKDWRCDTSGRRARRRGQSLHNGVWIEQGNFNYSMDDVTEMR